MQQPYVTVEYNVDTRQTIDTRHNTRAAARKYLKDRLYRYNRAAKAWDTIHWTATIKYLGNGIHGQV